MFKAEVYKKRRATLRSNMSSGIILMPANPESSMNYLDNTYPFRQDSTFSYFFGLNLPGMYGVIDIENETEYIFGNDYTIDDIIWIGPQPTVKELASQVGVNNVEVLNGATDFIKNATAEGRKIHYINPYRATVAMMIASMMDCAIADVKENQSLELIHAAAEMRLIKEAIEVEAIERQVDVAYIMHTEAMKMAREGVTELEIAGTIEGNSLKYANGVSFPVICSTNGQTLHNHSHGNVLKKGRMLICDAGSQAHNYYSSDITRTTPVGGRFDARQKAIYEIVLKANMDSIQAIKPEVPYFEIHKLAARIIVDGLKGLGLMQGDTDEAVNAGAHALFFPHGLGHALGLDVHDLENYGEANFGYTEDYPRNPQFGLSPRYGRPLKAGNVMTVEPGIYFIPELIDQFKAEGKWTNFINFAEVDKYRDFGGIRIEDDILVTATGHRVLGKPIPKTVAEIEAMF